MSYFQVVRFLYPVNFNDKEGKLSTNFTMGYVLINSADSVNEPRATKARAE
jgi:hypothetical protein